MNSLEWIDFEINFCKQKINKLRGEILYQKSMAILLPENNINLTLVNEFELSLNEEKINHLQQIKCKIEAWEVVKKKVKPVLKMDKEDYQPAYYWWIADELINLDTLDYQILKKALEVEND